MLRNSNHNNSQIFNSDYSKYFRSNSLQKKFLIHNFFFLHLFIYFFKFEYKIDDGQKEISKLF